MVGGILCNPVFAGIPPFEAAVDEATWIAAGVRMVGSGGLRQYLVNVLYRIEEVDAERGERIGGFSPKLISAAASTFLYDCPGGSFRLKLPFL